MRATVGLVRLGMVALDGTKVAANADDRANRTPAKLEEEVAEILQQAAEADQAEDRQHGPGLGEDLPAELANPSSRLARLQQAKARLETEAVERQRRYQQRVAELAAAARARGKQPRANIKPRARDEAPNPRAVANATDPDSRFLRTRNGTVQALRRGLAACKAEWKLLCGTHNLLKLWRQSRSRSAPTPITAWAAANTCLASAPTDSHAARPCRRADCGRP